MSRSTRYVTRVRPRLAKVVQGRAQLVHDSERLLVDEHEVGGEVLHRGSKQRRAQPDGVGNRRRQIPSGVLFPVSSGDGRQFDVVDAVGEPEAVDHRRARREQEIGVGQTPGQVGRDGHHAPRVAHPEGVVTVDEDAAHELAVPERHCAIPLEVEAHLRAPEEGHAATFAERWPGQEHAAREIQVDPERPECRRHVSLVAE